jgi:hypothetical protein
MACTLLNHYLYCKREDPEHTSAIVVVPDPVKASYIPFLKGTTVLGSISAKALSTNWPKEKPDLKLTIRYDPPRVHSGCVASNLLPAEIKRLHTCGPSNHLTFVFDGKVFMINDVTVDRSSTHSRSIHRNVLSGRIETKVLQICGDLDSIYDQLSLIGIASTLQWLQVQPCSCIDKP